jgi:hypothetical protein
MHALLRKFITLLLSGSAQFNVEAHNIEDEESSIMQLTRSGLDPESFFIGMPHTLMVP